MKIIAAFLTLVVFALSAAAQTAPVIFTPPASVTEIAGNHVLFSVTASGTMPLSYQWSFNNTPLAGATSDTLLLSAVTSAQAGDYTVKISNSLGSVTSAAAKLTVLSGAAANGVDPTFVVAPPPEDAPKLLVEQSNGKLLVVANFTYFIGSFAQKGIARLNRDGSLDPTFKPGGDLNSATVNSLALQPDGRIVVGGTFTSIGGIGRPGLARLNADGTLDLTFAPSAATFTSGTTILGLQADGKIVVTTGAGIYRVRSDGTLDSPLPLVISGDLFALAADGKIFAASVVHNGALPPGPTFGTSIHVVRYNLDGSPDTGFIADDLRVDPTSPLTSVTLIALGTLLNGKVTVVYNFGSTLINSGWVAVRFGSDGILDSSYNLAVPNADRLHNSPAPMISIRPDGQLTAAKTEWNSGLCYVARYDSAGHPNYTFSFPTLLQASSRFFSAVLALDSGEIVAAGNLFPVPPGISPSLLRLTPFTSNPPVIASTPATVTVNAGEPVPLSFVLAGSGPFAVSVNGGTATTNTTGIVDLGVPNAQQSATYAITVTNAAGSVTSSTVTVNVVPSAPSFTTQPEDTSAISAYAPTVTFTAVARGTEPFTYQWFFEGAPLSGATSPTLTVPTTAIHAGHYTLAVTNSVGQTLSRSALLSIEAGARISNLASRGFAGSGENVLIAGFAIAGSASKSLLVRAAGPALAKFSITGALADPQLTLYNSAGDIVAQNDDWATALQASAFDRVGAFRFDADSRDSALQVTLAPGSYTAVISNRAGGTGVALAEVYEADASSPRLINLSSRLLVGTGEQVAIPGIVISGAAPKKILIRGVGPALAHFGVQSPLADPVLTVVSAGNVTVATNDNWSSAANAAEISTTAASVGAFPLETGSKDAAVLVTLPPGAYTALLSGVGNTTGVTLVEVYEVP